MKKNYFTLLLICFFGAFVNAQTVIYDSSFDEASYDVAEVQTDLDNHPDWRSDHFTNNNATATFSANTAEQLLTGTNFAYKILATPITAVNGDVITITSVIALGFDNQAFDTTQDRNMTLVGLSPEAAPTASSVLGQQREGVIVQTIIADGGTVQLNNAGGTGNFAANPSITQADKSAYEVILEYTIGADAASSSKNVRIRNVGASNETSSIVSINGIRAEVYTALTGSGAYYFNWAQQFFQAGEGNINRIIANRLNITKNSAVLATAKFNNFEFSMSPNPVKNILNINTLETIKKVEIYNLLGKKVLASNNTNSVDVSSLSTSIYLVKLTSDKGVSTKKLVKN